MSFGSAVFLVGHMLSSWQFTSANSSFICLVSGGQGSLRIWTGRTGTLQLTDTTLVTKGMPTGATAAQGLREPGRGLKGRVPCWCASERVGEDKVAFLSSENTGNDPKRSVL